MTKVSKNVRGPSIARETAKGKPTVYAACKSVWSARGKIVNKASAKLGELGVPVKKAAILAFLSEREQEAASPFIVKKVGRGAQLVAA